MTASTRRRPIRLSGYGGRVESEEKSRSGGPKRAVSSGVGEPWLVDAENLWSSNWPFAEEEPAGRANGDRARLAVSLVTAHREIWTPNKCSYRGTCCGLPSAASGCWRFSRGPKVVAFLSPAMNRVVTRGGERGNWKRLLASDLDRPSTTPSRSSSSRGWRFRDLRECAQHQQSDGQRRVSVPVPVPMVL